MTIIDQWFAAASVQEDYKTMHVWDGDGNPNRVFEINFEGGYINRADVKAFMVNNTTQARTDLTVSFTGTNTLTLSQAVPATHQVTIYRDTPKSMPLASFVDGAIINAINLDRNAKQAVFAVAEMVDRFDSVTATAQDAIATAYTALSTANTAISDSATAVQTANAATSAAAGAVQVADDAKQAAAAATQTANGAKATAEGIDAKAQEALDNSETAITTANSAKTTAEGISATADDALEKAGDAQAKAAAAVQTANGVDAKAQQAIDKATEASQTANEAKQQVESGIANFDKLWAAVTTVDANGNVAWKGNASYGGTLTFKGGTAQGQLRFTEVAGGATNNRISNDVYFSTAQAEGRIRSYRNSADGGINFTASVDSAKSAEMYFTADGKLVTKSFQALGGNGMNNVFGANVEVNWGGKGARYQENGDIAETAGTTIIFRGVGGATNLSGSLGWLRDRSNDAWNKAHDGQVNRVYECRRGGVQETGMLNVNIKDYEVPNGYITGYHNYVNDGNIRVTNWIFRTPMWANSTRGWVEFTNV